MARPERNTVDYFPHFISDGKKMFFIEKKYGNDGYATWFKILEKISITENHFLNLNDEQEVIYLSAKCNISEDLLFGIINDLTRVGVFDKKLWEKRIIWSQKFIDEIQQAYSRRNNKCITFDGLCKHLLSLGIHYDDINTQSRVDKSRVDVSKDTIVGLGKPTTTGSVPFSERCQMFIDNFNKIKGSKYQVTNQVKKSLKARLLKYNPKQILDAIKTAIKDPTHIEQNFKNLTPEYILRETILDKYLNITSYEVKSTTNKNSIYEGGQVGN